VTVIDDRMQLVLKGVYVGWDGVGRLCEGACGVSVVPLPPSTGWRCAVVRRVI
jgi:hypothetical protein